MNSYRTVKSENILAKQLAKFFRYSHSHFLSLAQYTKHYHTKLAVFPTYNPKVLSEENIQINELFCFSRAADGGHSMVFSAFMVVLFIPVCLQTLSEGAQRTAVGFGSVSCCPQLFHGMQDRSGSRKYVQ